MSKIFFEISRFFRCEGGKRANVTFELTGVWLPNAEAEDRRLLLFYVALQKPSIAIKSGDELLCDPPE